MSQGIFFLHHNFFNAFNTHAMHYKNRFIADGDILDH